MGTVAVLVAVAVLLAVLVGVDELNVAVAVLVVAVAVLVVAVAVLVTEGVTFLRLIRTNISSPKNIPPAVDILQVPRT
jgi:hypothetical protein